MRKLLMKIKNSSPKKKFLYNFFLVALSLAVILVITLSFYVGRVFYIKNYGIKLVPLKNHSIQVSSYYRQNDPRWQDVEIGTSRRKMGSTGCLISSVSTAISQLRSPVTPEELNKMLTQVNGFQGADLIWYKINEVFPEIDYRYSRIFSREKIEKDLEEGLLPIVNVKYNKTGVTHWVLIVGADDGEFIICDPLGDGNSTRLLSDHGNVFAYRVIEKVAD